MRRRYRCSVIGCKCTVWSEANVDGPGGWALCRKHWPLVTRDVKRVIRRLEKRMDQAFAMNSNAYGRRWSAYRRVMRRVVTRLNALEVGI